MVQLLEGGAYLLNGTEIVPDTKDAASVLESQLGSVPSKEGCEKADHCLWHSGVA